MRTVGIIAEYNPFHTGHEYHLQKAKELSGADYAVVVMSPDYVQRGAPAIFDKYTRAEMALRCGADLILELPLSYATGSAEYFAEGAVRLLDALGVIDSLCGGVEMAGESGTSATVDVGMFQALARILLMEPEPYRLALQEGLRRGLTFPRARAEALNQYTGACAKDARHSLRLPGEVGLHLSEVSDLLSSPNNILAIEYCKALEKIRSRITPMALLRRGSSYSDLSLDGEFCSAGAIRDCLEKGNVSLPDSYIPEDIQTFFLDACACPVFSDDLLPILMQKLICCDNPETVFDLPPELAKRICRLRYQCIGKSFHEIAAFLKTKQMTEARVRRALLHLILNIQKEAVEAFCRNGYVYYARILGFRREAAPLLHEIKRKTSLPLITKTANAQKQLSETGRQMWSLDLAASHLYSAIRAERYGVSFQSEQKISPVNL
ncbi:MAG: nucleotidyltransferase family protein [Lachnospiraceae bacterium]|nr:nucleotidyltransferase family protein [Lachnospiraceae bacterium]